MLLTPADLNKTICSKKQTISCIHLNAQSARNKEESLTALLTSFDFCFDLAMVTETWYHNEDEVLNLPGYVSYFLNRSDKRGGGIMLLANKRFQCELIDSFTQITDDFEVLTVKSSNAIFSVLYRPPGGNVHSFLSFLDTYLAWSNDNNSTMVLGGDLNIDLLSLTSQRVELLTVLEANAFANVIKDPTRIQLNSSTLIDLFITNENNIPLCSGVLGAHISDHLPICLVMSSISLQIKRFKKPVIKYRNINDTTMQQFSSALSNANWDAVICSENPDDAYEMFIENFKSIYDKCFPYKTKRKPRKARKPWITSDCLKAIKEKNVLYQRFLRTRNAEDLHNFKQHRNKTNSLLRKSRNWYFENLFSTDGAQSSAIIWKHLNALLKPQSGLNSGPLEIVANGQTIAGEELANTFNDYFVSITNSTHDPNCIRFLNFRPKLRESAFLYPSTAVEIRETMLSLKNSNSCDIEGLQIKPIKNTIDTTAGVLEYIINQIFSQGKFPKRLQLARVSVIFKGGDRNIMSNYRPISILPIFSKVVEKLIHKRMTAFMTIHTIMTPCQFGFIKNRSTESALLFQKEIILNSFEQESYMLGIFVDYSKAFDRINHRTLAEKLEHYGFRGQFLQLLNSYLNDRKQQVVIDGSKSTFLSLREGIPQGSILGPLLFNIYVNDVAYIDEDCRFVMYADDISLYFSGNTITELETKANNVLAILNSWSLTNSLSINVSKTKAVLFRPRNKKVDLTLSLTLGTCNIELVPTVKNLGVIFNECMSWNPHVQSVCRRLARTVGVLSRLRNVLPQNVKILIYNSLFLSTLSYCFLIWGTTTKTNINKIHILQKKAVRALVNVPYDAHTGPIFHNLKLLPVQNLYDSLLLTRYNNSIKKNDSFLRDVAALTVRVSTYDTRCTDIWKIPYIRTDYGRQMLRFNLPAILNSSPF